MLYSLGLTIISMRTPFRTQILAGAALLLLAACGQETIISSTTSAPTATTSGKVAMIDYNVAGSPFSFSYPQGWTVKQINANRVSIASPAMIAEQKQFEGEDFRGDGIPGAPEVAINYYANIADEPNNKARQYGAKTLAEYLEKDPDDVVLGKTTIDGIPATQASRSGLGPLYIIYIPKGAGLYTVEFNHRDTDADLTAEERSILLSLKLLK